MLNKLIRSAVGILFLILLGFGLWVWGSLKFVYSSGERAGYVQKFSKKGWVFKTWEGELAMVALPGMIPEKFFFTVRTDSIAQKIQGVMGQRVVLKYDEHKGIPGQVFGDTSYFVSDIVVVEDPSQPKTFPATPKK